MWEMAQVFFKRLKYMENDVDIMRNAYNMGEMA